MQELVRVDGTTVGTGDRKVEPAGVGEAVLEFEGVTVLSHEQAAGGEIRAHGAVLFDGVVGTASANVDRAGGGTHGRSATDHGGEEQAVGAELEAGTHVETVYPASSTAAAKAALRSEEHTSRTPSLMRQA